MRQALWVSLVLLMAGCCAPPAMTMCDYNQISCGDAIYSVQECFGRPYEVRSCADGSDEYIYIERIYYGNHPTGAQRHYVFLVEDGEIVGKCSQYLEDPIDVIQFDHYDYN